MSARGSELLIPSLDSQIARSTLAAMFIKRHGPPGTPPATLSPHLVDGKSRKPSIQLVIFKKIKWL